MKARNKTNSPEFTKLMFFVLIKGWRGEGKKGNLLLQTEPIFFDHKETLYGVQSLQERQIMLAVYFLLCTPTGKVTR